MSENEPIVIDGEELCLYVTGFHKVPTRIGIFVFVVDCSCGWSTKTVTEERAEQLLQRHSRKHRRSEQ